MKSQSMYLKMIFCLLFLLSFTSIAYAHPLGQQGGSSAFSHSSDIGHVEHRGATIANGDTYRIWGAGDDIWGWHDQFHYAWTHLSGDGQVVVQVQKQEATDDWAKAGIMLRSSLDDNAANVFLALTPEHGTVFQWRSATHEYTRQRSDSSLHIPSWLKLVRHHLTVTGFTSSDGSTWKKVSSVNISLHKESLIGLAVTAHSNRTRSRAVFTHVQLTRGTPVGPPAYTATRVYGQPNFTSKTANNGGISAHSLNVPWSVLTDNNGNLYVADYSNNRVLYYPAGSTTATRVYGQPNFTTGTANTGGISASSLSNPAGLILDVSGNLYIADYSNNRVLYYPAGNTTATRVYGQANFTTGTSNTGGISAGSLSGPMGLALNADGGLYVADDGNNRVLYYPAGHTTSTRVYGQPNFTTVTSNTGGVSATSLNDDETLALDSSGNLFVGDCSNNRVLYFPAGSTTGTRVYGQPNFTSNATNYGGISASSIDYPQGVTLDSSSNLYVADYGNNRVLMFPHT